MVKISVIVTVYNIDKYIDNCLKSILNQTYKNFEVLIINDGSTDNSQKIIDKYVKKDNRFKSFIKENSGIADSRNYGISKVNGDYFIFIDGDDSINSELLERLSQVISKHDYDLIKYNAKKISPNREVIDENCFFENIDGEEAFLKLFNNSLFDTVWSYAYKKSFWDDNKFMFEKGRVHEDFGLVPYVVLKANEVHSMGYVGYNYYVRENSIMTSNSLEKLKKKTDDALFHFENLLNIVNRDKKINEEVKVIFRSYIANAMISRSQILDGKMLKEYINKLKSMDIYKYLIDDTIVRKIKKLFFRLSPSLYIKLMIKR